MSELKFVLALADIEASLLDIEVVCTYGIQLWNCGRKSNINMIQTFQTKVLRCLVDALWYVRNDNLHSRFQCRSCHWRK